MTAIATACTLNASAYLALYLYGLVCIIIGFGLGSLFVIRPRTGGYRPISDLQDQPSAPPRKP